MLKYDKIDGNKLLVSASVLFVVTGTFVRKIFRFQPKVCDGCFDKNQI